MNEEKKSKQETGRLTEEEKPAQQENPIEMETDPEKTEQTKTEETGQKKRHPNSVFTYIAILFAVAFFLLLLSYFMQQRNTAQMIEGLQSSATAMENIEMLQQRNIELEKQVDTLTEQLNEYKSQVETLSAQVIGKEENERKAEALEQFWKLVQAYENGAYRTCREMIDQMNESGLVSYLPNTEGADAVKEFETIQAAVKK